MKGRAYDKVTPLAADMTVLMLCSEFQGCYAGGRMKTELSGDLRGRWRRETARSTARRKSRVSY